MVKALGARRRTRSRHHSLREAGEELAGLLRGEGRPEGLEWGAIYDTAKGKPSDPNTVALLLCGFNRERAAGTCAPLATADR
jgi:hypothetical protein